MKTTLTASVLAAVALLAGCVGVETDGEKRARLTQASVGQVYRPRGERPALPKLDPNAPLQDFLLYAMLNQPQIEAAYFDWAASVQRITVERSLPDPRLTFQSDIADTVMTLMPGLMMDFPGPGKLKAAANVATAESDARYFLFESAVLQTAFALKKSYYQLHFLEAKVGVNQQTLALVADLEKLARTQNEVGKVTLQDVLRAQIEQERLTTEIANLEDSRNPLLAQFKAALGLSAEQPNPPAPTQFESTPLDLSSEQLFATALARNPRLRAMEAEVRRADASLRLAYKSRVPDFNLGVEVDAKASPVIVTPQLGVTLPIWRDKIAAEIAGAQAGKRAAEARLSAEQIALAVEFAEKTFMFRESSRNLALLQERLLPKARQSVEVARAAYLSGQLDFLNLIDAQRTLLGFQLSEVESRTQRELALTELSLLILGQPPARAPLLHSESGTRPPTAPRSP
ncbi:MAG TPA: TolC family protein [Candidatus Saccharimonadales bacterium]|nr:TolC family protein [Candidatus Saccharimonadales bacterium]